MYRFPFMAFLIALALVLAACGPQVPEVPEQNITPILDETPIEGGDGTTTEGGDGTPTTTEGGEDASPTISLTETSVVEDAPTVVIPETVTVVGVPTVDTTEGEDAEATATDAVDDEAPTVVIPETVTVEGVATVDTAEDTGTPETTGTATTTPTEGAETTETTTATPTEGAETTETTTATPTEGAEGGAAVETEDNLVEVMEADGRFTILLSMDEAAGLIERLQQEGPYTIFAPTDDALENLGIATLIQLTSDEYRLTNVLLYHVAEGELSSEDVLDTETISTLQGTEIDVSVAGDTVLLNDTVQVTETDIPASNGVIHVVDGVLMPPEN
jgi:uncharacterized surface protein with fasciclin (FAS1) repeats